MSGNRYASVPNNNGNSNPKLFVQSETGREETILKPALTMPLPHVNRSVSMAWTVSQSARILLRVIRAATLCDISLPPRARAN